jgi:hypothetical protein
MAKSETSRPAARALTEGQRAYEAKRAAKAGMSVEKWLAAKDREAARAEAKVKVVVKPVKKPGLLGRLIEKAHKPLK